MLRPNIVLAKGFVINEPKSNKLDSGKSVISVVVSTTDYYKNDKDEYVNISHPLDFTTFFDSQIKYIEGNVKKGDYVEIYGNVVRLKKTLKDKDGKEINRYKYALTLREINKLFSGDKIIKKKSEFEKKNDESKKANDQAVSLDEITEWL